MRHWIRPHLTYANAMATLAVFLVLSGGTAMAAYVVSSNSQVGPNTISGHKPPTGEHANIIADSITGGDIANGSLHAVDVGQAAFAGLSVKIGALSAHQCRTDPINGISAKGDHLLLTPSVGDGYLQEIHAIRYDPSSGDSGDTYVQTCNVTNTSLPGHLTHFNLLIFNAH